MYKHFIPNYIQESNPNADDILRKDIKKHLQKPEKKKKNPSKQTTYSWVDEIMLISMTKLHKDKPNGKKVHNGNTFPCSKFKIDANNKTINLLHIYKFLCKYKVSAISNEQRISSLHFFSILFKSKLGEQKCKRSKEHIQSKIFPVQTDRHFRSRLSK